MSRGVSAVSPLLRYEWMGPLAARRGTVGFAFPDQMPAKNAAADRSYATLTTGWTSRCMTTLPFHGGLLRRGTLRCRRHPSLAVAIHLRRTRFTTPVLRESIRTNREEGRQMGIIAFIILGLLAGAIAKAIMPGDDPGGWIITAVIGVVGAILGGFLAGALFGADPMDEFFDISSWLTAIVGSIILLALYRVVVNRGGGHRALRT